MGLIKYLSFLFKSKKINIKVKINNIYTIHECSSCFETKETIYLDCRHYYCKFCLLAMFESMINSKNNFKLICCKKYIDINLIYLCQNIEILNKYSKILSKMNKKIENIDLYLLELSKKKGWKNCPKCNIIIEKSSGCNAIRCTNCYSIFCYICKKPGYIITKGYYKGHATKDCLCI